MHVFITNHSKKLSIIYHISNILFLNVVNNISLKNLAFLTTNRLQAIGIFYSHHFKVKKMFKELYNNS